MSKSVDERIVQMKFDNKQFEQGVSQTMSTLDKFKAKLNLTGATKGLENIKTSAKNVNLADLSKAIDTVNSRFSTMGIIGTTALTRITNSAITAGKNIVSTLTNSVITGGKNRAQNIKNAKFQIEGLLGTEEYKKKWARIDESINYAVKDTAYGYDSAAKAASQLLASQVEIGEQMDSSLRAISGVAAMTNSSYDDISAVFTRVAGQGRVMADDLNSLASRGMNAAATLGEAMGHTESEIRDMVSKGKISFKDFATAMDDAFGAHAKKGNETFDGALNNMKAAAARVGEKIWDPLLDNLRDVFNGVRKNINAINNLLGPKVDGKIVENSPIGQINKFLTTVLQGIKSFLEGTDKVSSKIRSIFDGIDNIVKPISTINNAVDTVKDNLKDYNKLVDEIIYGTWDNGLKRREKLTEAGYYYEKAQNMVNERLGCAFRYELKYNESVEETTKVEEKNIDTKGEMLEQLNSLSDAQLRSQGYTDEQIDSIRSINTLAKKLGYTVQELINKDQELQKAGSENGLTTMWILFDSLSNIGQALKNIISAIGQAISDAFSSDNTNLIFDLVTGIHNITEKIKKFTETAGPKIMRILRGLFSIISLIVDIIVGTAQTAFNILISIFNALFEPINTVNGGLLELLAKLGDLIYNGVQWVKNNSLLVDTFNAIIYTVQDAIRRFTNYIKTNEKIQAVVKKVTDLFNKQKEGIHSWAKGLLEANNKMQYIFGNMIKVIKNFLNNTGLSNHIPKNIFQGLVNGIKTYGGKAIEMIANFFISFIDKAKEILGIHSPSKVFYAIGGFIVAGLISGFKDGEKDIIEALKTGFNNIISYVKNIPWGSIFVGGLTTALVYSVVQVSNSISKIAGAIENATSFLSDIGTAITDISGSFKNIGLSMILKSIALIIVAIAGSLFIISKINADRLWPAVGALSTILGVLTACVAALIAIDRLNINKFTKSKVDYKGLALLFVGMGASLLLISKAIETLGNLERGQLAQGVAVTIGIIAAIAAIAFALNKAKNINKAIKNASNSLLKTVAAILVLAFAMKMFGNLSVEQIAKGIVCIGALSTFIIAMIAISALSGKYSDKAGKMVLKIAISMRVMASAMKTIGKMDKAELKQALDTIKTLSLIIAAFIGLGRFAKSEMTSIGLMMLSLSGALLIITGVMYLMKGLKLSDMLKGAAVMGALYVFIYAMVKITKEYSAKNLAELGLLMMQVASAILIISLAIAILGFLKEDQLKRGTTVMIALGAMMAALIYVAKDAQPTQSAVKMLRTVLIGLALLIAGVIGLSFIEGNKLETIMKSMAMLITSLAAVIYALGNIEINNDTMNTSIKALAKLLPIMAAVGVIVTLISKIPTNSSVINNAIAISILMGALAGMCFAIKKIGEVKINKSTIATMLVLEALMVPLAGIIKAMSATSNASSVIANATALSILMSTLSGIVAGIMLLSKYTKAKNSFASIAILLVGLTGMIALTQACVGVLKSMDGMSVDLNSVKALSVMMLTLSSIIAIFVGIGALIGKLGGGAGLLGALVVVATGLAGMADVIGLAQDCIGVLKSMDGMETAEKNAEVLGSFMKTLADVLFQISIVAPLALVADIALKGLIRLIGIIGVFATAVGALMDKFPKLEEFLDKGLPILEKIAKSIGTVLGNLIGGFLSGATAGIEDIGTRLSNFANNLSPFLTTMGSINSNMINGMDILTETILKLTAAKFINNILDIISLGKTFAELGTRLSDFANNASGFINTVAGVDPKALEGAKNLADAVLSFTAAGFLDAIAGWLKGEINYEAFANNIGKFGTGIKTFITEISSLEEGIDLNVISTACEALKTIAEASESIPKIGGMMQAINGETDLEGFADAMPELAEGIKGFINGIKDIDDKQLTKVDSFTNAMKAIADVANAVPATDGWKQKIAGTKDLAGFAGDLGGIAESFRGMIYELTKVEDNGVTLVNDSSIELANKFINALKSIIEAANSMPDSKWGDNKAEQLVKFAAKLGEIAKSFRGAVWELKQDNVLDEFGINAMTSFIQFLYGLSSLKDVNIEEKGKQLESATGSMISVSHKMKELFESFKDLTVETIEAITEKIGNIIEVFTSFNTIEDVNLGDKGTALESFGGSLISFCNKLNEASNSLNGIDNDALEGNINKIKKFEEVATSVNEIDGSKVEAFADSLKKLSESGVSAFSDNMSSEDSKNKAINSVSAFIDSAKDAVNEERKSAVQTRFTEISTSAINGLDNNGETTTKFYEAGSNFVQGFVNAINNENKAYTAAYNLGLRAVKGVKAGTDEHSPSKLTFQTGKYFVQGFINGVNKYADNLYDNVYELGNGTTNEFTNVISRISDIINSDVDAQPTIRPVLDLSDVESGAKSINSMLNIGSNIGLSSNLSSISTSINRQLQNRGNNDVVSAIDSLSKSLSGNTGNTYNVNGITYNDEGDVSDAIRTLIKATQIERRM